VSKFLFFLVIFNVVFTGPAVYASGTMTEDEVKNVNRVDIKNEEERQQLSITAGLLAYYEIAAKKLVGGLENGAVEPNDINKQAKELLTLSEKIFDTARFRLPQCDEYLAKTLELKNILQKISHDTLEKDYHHDGALPKAPGECYHTKDLFIHPATVLILTRDDPSLSESTKTSINAEITEVLAHTEYVRQLVIY
jgi:hypothetical protein